MFKRELYLVVQGFKHQNFLNWKLSNTHVEENEVLLSYKHTQMVK